MSILNTNFDSTETHEIVLPADTYNVQIMKLEERKSDSGTEYLTILCKTLQPATSRDGEPVPAGHLLRGTIFLTPNENNTEASIERQIKKFMRACGVESGCMSPLSQWEGKTVAARVKIRKGNEEYPDDSNIVGGFIL